MYSNYKTFVLDRILSRSIKRHNGCVEYQGNWKHAYGLISITINGKRKSVPAHRALWMAAHDRFDLPKAVQIRHKCDNPRCVNEQHLLEGTAKQNMQDCIERGRKAKSYKLHTRYRIHADDKILAIRNAIGNTKDIAIQYGISISYVSKLRNMKAKTLI
jgi:hypothetical protein